MSARQTILIRVTATGLQEQPSKVLVGVGHIIQVRPSRDGGALILLPDSGERNLDCRLLVRESVDEIEALVRAATGGRRPAALTNGSH